MKTYTKTFGITKVNDHFCIVTEIITELDRFGKPFTYKHIHYDLKYKKAEFAIKKAECFIKACHKPFINFQNEKVNFEFVNLGIIS